VNEADCCFVGRLPVRICGAAEDAKNFEDLVVFVVRWLVELCVRQQGVHDAEVGMAERDQLVGEVEEVADYDVQEDSQVVGVKVFVCCSCGEEEVEELKDEELEGCFCLTIEEQDDVLPECHI